MTAKAVMSSHKPIRIYMGALILGVIQGFCFLKLFLMVGKELKSTLLVTVMIVSVE